MKRVIETLSINKIGLPFCSLAEKLQVQAYREPSFLLLSRGLHIVALLLTFITPCFANAYDAFEEMYDHMQYLTERDKILSQNIANSDTPKYRPQDIKKSKSALDDVSLALTNNMHMDINDTTDYTLFSPKVDELKPNGNGVNLERELFKKSENSQKLTEATNVYNKSKSILNTAIQGMK